MEHADKSAPEEWKELISHLPSVLNAEFVLDEGGSVRELHVLSGTDRNAKQIVRDIQSAMMARFGIELDHRVISVAQIPHSPGSMELVRRDTDRLICSGIDISIRNSGCEVAVELMCRGEQYVGHAKAGSSAIERRRAAAEATLDAISQFAGDACRLRLGEVRSATIAGSEAVLAAVTISCEGREELLVGSCVSRDEEPLTAVRATLDALNRRLAMVLS